ncbi:DUF4468 domain-containing protein [Pedobacter frigoris]|uniref:DUF4468 domain-containing protein n=1 Tax=Pedobacter frigoris TaxID=2571272 RepID=UPI00292D67FF|nr:DUF4468 domain-containing protein [Pedobacter frigoris]
MKFISGLFFLLMISLLSLGQERPLSYDERGKLIHYEVVEQIGVSKADLSARADRFFKQRAKQIKLKSGSKDTVIQADGKIVINKTALVLNRPSGEVKYNFNVECRDGKYRFWLTDFVFIPYQRDRYGNFVAATTVGTPLENEPGKLNAAEWKGYINNTGKEAGILAAQFKESMANKQEIKPAGKSREIISTKKW